MSAVDGAQLAVLSNRFAAIVRSAPAPPAMYANASALSALRADASSCSASTGTRGLVPLIPAR